jgi:hypothetical protein
MAALWPFRQVYACLDTNQSDRYPGLPVRFGGGAEVILITILTFVFVLFLTRNPKIAALLSLCFSEFALACFIKLLGGDFNRDFLHASLAILGTITICWAIASLLFRK